MNKIAIVILNWNGAAMMRAYLPSVVAHSRHNADIYVADNASTDDSRELLAVSFPECRVIRLDQNWGFAEGYNKALRQVEAEYYLLLNSDVEVTEGWLRPLLDFMEEHADVAACQPKMLSMVKRDQFEYAGACGGFIDSYGYPYCRGRLFDTLETDHGQYDDNAEIDWASGAALMVRSRDYWDVGGLDARFFAHNEEIDLCWRLRLRGRKIYCVPASRVYHLGGGTLPKGNHIKTFYNFRNNLTMLYKCLPGQDLRHVMRVRCFLDYLAAFQSVIKNRDAGDFKAICRARKEFRRWLPQFKADRAAIQSSCVAGAHTSVNPIRLLWQYYLRGRRRYSDIPECRK